jgi:uncharacterized membrane protein YjgN (DUF898 family)
MAGFMFSIIAPLARAGGPPAEPTIGQIGQIYLLIGLLALGAAVIFAPYQAAALRSVAAGISFDGVRLKLNVLWYETAWMTLSNIVLATLSLGFLMPFVQARSAKFLLTRLQTDGLADLDGIQQSAAIGPGSGEGLADAFGLSPI